MTSNLKPLGHFLGLGVLAFATIAIVRIWNAGLPSEALFTLACCVNLWYLAVKKHHDKSGK